MSKIVPISLGAAGAGGAGLGGYLLFPSDNKEAIVTTIRKKYEVALLNTKEDSEIGRKKYTALGTYSPHNPILRDAASKKTGSSPNEGTIKQPLKDGCEAIYSSDANDPNNFSDFKALCSKTNENATGTGKNGVTDEPSSSASNKGDTVLTALKNHETTNKGVLDSVLSALKEEIKNDQTFTPEKRTKLKNWCNSIKSEVFLGAESAEFKSQEDFCKVTG